MLKDFEEFLKRGNVLGLAVGLVIGAAFGKIIATLVEGILMPIVGLFTGGMNFAELCWNISGKPIESCSQAKANGIAVLQYGQLTTDIISFIIISFVVFLIARWAIKLFSGLDQDTGPTSEELLTEIRDIMIVKAEN